MAVSGTIYPTWIDAGLLKTCHGYNEAFLGRGAFGAVVKAFMEDHNRTVAVKLINAGGNNFDDFTSEVAKLSAVSTCENIITPLGWFTYAGWAGIVMEYAECGNLHELLHTRGVNLPLCLKSRILYELISGVNHLHRLGNDQRLLHLDLKPQNILFDADLHVKICDLGGSVWSNLTKDFTRSTMDSDEGPTNVYSLAYCAPERLRHSNRRPTSKADIYSIGVITWQVITQRKPYEDFTSRDELKNFVIRGGRCALSTDFIQQQGALNRQLARNATSLIRGCWGQNPTNRKNALEIMQQFNQDFPFSQREASVSAAVILQGIPERSLSRVSATASFLDITGLNRTVHPENLLHPVPVTTDTSSNQDTNSAPSTQDSSEVLGGVSGANSCRQIPPTTAQQVAIYSAGASGGSRSRDHNGNNKEKPKQRGAAGILRSVKLIGNEMIEDSPLLSRLWNRRKGGKKHRKAITKKDQEEMQERINATPQLKCFLLGDKGIGKHIFANNHKNYFSDGVMRIDGKEYRVTFQRERRFQCDIVLLCYAGNDRRSLYNLVKWMNEPKQFAGVLRIDHPSGKYAAAALDEGYELASAFSLSHHIFPTFSGCEVEQKQAYECIFISALSAAQRDSKKHKSSF